MLEILQDVRYAARTLRRSVGMTIVIVVSLAIGIGANTAIFSVVNALLLKPLPYPDPDRLAVLWLRSPGVNIPQDWPSPGQYIVSAALTRLMASLLFGVSATDLLTFSIVPLILIATAMVATYIPARRATRVDPVVALRDE